jgi:hypothetical protein
MLSTDKAYSQEEVGKWLERIKKSAIEIDKVTIPQFDPSLYSVIKVIMFKCQKDWSARTKVIAQNPLCL